MNFFTIEWWLGNGDRSGNDALFESYDQHVSSIRKELPSDLLDLHDNHTLHDSRVEHIASSFTSRTVKITLSGWNRSLSRPILYELEFQGVEVFEQHFPSGRKSNPELGDLGYWELDLDNELSVVRLLFVSSAEFRLVFRGFSFLAKGQPN